MKRTGLLVKKIGMTRLFVPSGEAIPVTLLHVDHCQVVGHKTQAAHGYTALQLGAGEKKPQRESKAMRGVFSKSGVTPKALIREFRVPQEAFLEVGASLGANHFVVGQRVDVIGTSLGKGFAGPMKRHNFGGLRASHGVSISHRSHGSIGQREWPGRVFKNKKMAGHLGVDRVTIQNLEVVWIDEGQALIAVRGAVPGGKGSCLMIRDALKKKLPEGVPFPAGVALGA